VKSLRFAVGSAIAIALAPQLLGARALNNKEQAVVVAIQEEATNASKDAGLCVVIGNHLNDHAILSELRSRKVKVEWGPCSIPAHAPRNEITIERIKEPIPGTYDIVVELSEINAGKKTGIPSRQGTYEVRVRAGSEPEILEYRPAQALEQGSHFQ
jgi:hypothetical protein